MRPPIIWAGLLEDTPSLSDSGSRWVATRPVQVTSAQASADVVTMMVLPSVDPPPYVHDLLLTVRHIVAIVGRGGHAGVVRRDPDLVAHT